MTQDARVLLNASLIAERNLVVEGVLAHELGHAFGLLHPCGEEGAPQCTSSDESSIMHPLYDASRATLDEDDRAGICALFAAAGTPTAGEVGDSCTTGLECRTNICGSAGLCASPCRAGTCDRGFQCMDGICETARAGFGESCAAGADCATGLCVVHESGSTCTRECGAGCPPATLCEAVDNRAVCEPESNDGCSAASSTKRGSNAPSILILLAACSLTRRRASQGRSSQRRKQ